MAGAKDSQPTQVIYRLICPRSSPINGVILHFLCLECTLAVVNNSIRCSEPAEPVADPVGVAGPDEDCDTGLDD